LKQCEECSMETSNYYEIKTNAGPVFRCKSCYEVTFMRDQRTEYNSAYQNCDMSTQIRKKF
jgi:uncharacterized Zn finger protein